MTGLLQPFRSRRIWIAVGLLCLAWLGWRLVRPTPVTALVVARRDLVQTVVASGRVRSFSRVRLGASLTGVVSEVLVREGLPVRAGQLLIRIDEDEARGVAEQARASEAEAEARLDLARHVNREMAAARLRQAEATLAKARADSERLRGLAEAGIASTDQLELARQSLELAQGAYDVARLESASLADGGAEQRRAQAALEQARGARRAAEARLAHTRIVAPADGTILTRDVEPGDAVQPGRVLMEMALAAETQLTAEPDEKNLALLQSGQKALASADAFPEQRFAARVVYVSPSVDAQRGTIEVRLAVEAPPPYLRPDMTVSVEIEVARRAGALAVPADAVREPASLHPWALVIRHGRVVRQELRLGARGESWTEVAEGLAEGEALVPATVKGVTVGQRARARLGSADAL